MPDELTPKQAVFVAEFLVDKNGTQAAIRAGYSPKTADQQASRLLTNVKVAEAIEAGLAKQIERVEITQDEVLQRFWLLATADPNELTQMRRLCCRYCHGKGHAYQWRSQVEFDRECAAVIGRNAKLSEGATPEPMPSADGGYGFDPRKAPVSPCPECNGEGLVDVFFADTRKLSEAGKMLFAGVKTTQHGIEIKMNDRLGALEIVAKHLGMFKTSLELTGKKALDDALKSLDDDE